ncbi:MAG: 6,7-dimethyl-8-ribityllumazine synthase [Actinomycetota bacterium]|nr:6,7-dimethyl-8-ribityllumazine synthase [Actinomycetota bacterium]
MIEGSLDGHNMHVGIAVASWNQAITDRLLDAANQRCADLGVDTVTVMRVPGALELPIATKALMDKGCDAVVAIGTVIKGETDHYDIVVRESNRGIAEAALKTGVPVGNAILAVHDFEDAASRAGSGANNKGTEAVDAAIQTASALAQLRQA